MNKKITNKIIKLLKEAKKASYELTKLSSDKKNEILRSMSQVLSADKALIIEANKKDLIIAKQKKLSNAFIDRLTLTDKRIESMAKSLSDLANLEDPVGSIIKEYSRPNGLLIKKV
ncbi:MAG: gamma-glutamyl-phosphate reductase, partial [Candidatus Omnitrophota bacterium]